MTKNKTVILKELGVVNYKKAWEYQTELFNQKVELKKNNRVNNQDETVNNHLIICEHNHVITLGKSGDQNNLLLNESQLKFWGIDFHKINRGGDITYHGPGQIVCYPIFDLENFKPDLHWYMRQLEEVIIRTLANWNINAGRINGLTGVWIDIGGINPRKICAFGIKVSRWITLHGLAFNVNSDLSFFDKIIPCGISDKSVTSMEKELGKKIDVELVKKELIKNFELVFEFKLNI